MAPKPASHRTEKQFELEEILVQLMVEELSGYDEIENWLDSLRDVYLEPDGTCNDFRHYYSSITTMMFWEEFSESDDPAHRYDFYSSKIQTLESNLGMMLDAALRRNDELHKPLAKLYDHVSLELARINYNARINETQDRRFKDVYERTDAAREAAEESIERAKRAMEHVEETKAQVQRENVTVLGIFTGIVVAFVAGMTFTSSVLQNMGDVSMYRLCMMVGIVAFFFVNLLALLLSFLCRVAKVDDGPLTKIVKRADVAIGLFLLLVIAARLLLPLPPYPG